MRTLLGLVYSFLGGAARLQHLQTDQKQDESAGNLEGRERDTKQLEDE